MSYHPDNIPEKPSNLPLGGENPNNAGHLENIPYKEDPLELHYGDDKKDKQKVDTGELAQVQTGQYWSPRPPAQELPTPTVTETEPVKKSKLKRNLIIGGTALTVFGVGSLVTVHALLSSITNAADKDLPPAPGTSNSGELVPGQSDTTDTTPVEKQGGHNTDAYKFLAEDGKTSQTYEQLIASTTIPVEKYPDALSAQIRFYELMTEVVNYDPTEEEVRNNLGVSADQQLTIENYREAAAIKRDLVYDHLFGKEAAGLRKFMSKLGSDVYDVQIANYGTSATGEPETKYKANLEFAKTHDAIIVTDNVEETELVNPATGITAENVTGFLTGTYNLTFTGFAPDQVTEDKEKVWKFGDRLVIKRAE